MPKIKVLIIGSGAREHALAWKIAQSPLVGQILAAPGNPGTAKLGKNIDIAADDINKLAAFAKKNQIDLTVVGPEIALANGIVDEFNKQNLLIFGPTAKAARLESSKEFSKKFMKSFNIPTAGFEIFKDYRKASEYLKICKYPLVVKADGLAGGKGVVICQNKSQAFLALQKIMIKKIFGGAGKTVIIEDCLQGKEVSVICITDGEKAQILPIAQDHKRIGEADTGLNTGGMGAVAPVPEYSKPEFINKVLQKIIYPTLKGMQKLRTPFRGALYAGLMVKDQDIKVLEFNCRFGDPETQVQLPLIKNDFAKLLLECSRGNLTSKIMIEKKFCAGIVLASLGYPQKYKTGQIITLPAKPESIIFHAGTELENRKLVTSGGRVLTVVTTDAGLKKALTRVYNDCRKIKFKGKYCRKDIGKKIMSK